MLHSSAIISAEEVHVRVRPKHIPVYLLQHLCVLHCNPNVMCVCVCVCVCLCICNMCMGLQGLCVCVSVCAAASLRPALQFPCHVCVCVCVCVCLQCVAWVCMAGVYV